MSAPALVTSRYVGIEVLASSRPAQRARTSGSSASILSTAATTTSFGVVGPIAVSRFPTRLISIPAWFAYSWASGRSRSMMSRSSR